MNLSAICCHPHPPRHVVSSTNLFVLWLRWYAAQRVWGVRPLPYVAGGSRGPRSPAMVRPTACYAARDGTSTSTRSSCRHSMPATHAAPHQTIWRLAPIPCRSQRHARRNAPDVGKARKRQHMLVPLHPHPSVSIAPLANHTTPAVPATRACRRVGIGSSWPVSERHAWRVEAELSARNRPRHTSRSIRNHPLACAHSRLVNTPTAQQG
jgi:hypothetical protein